MFSLVLIFFLFETYYVAKAVLFEPLDSNVWDVEFEPEIVQT